MELSYLVGGIQTMNQSTIQCINELVFMEKLNLFEKTDVILYHPGHFPELNEQLLDYYHQYGAKVIMIPGVFNQFLKCHEFDYYAPLLINRGIEKEKLISIPVTNDIKGVDDVIQSAFHYLNNTNHKNILLAGKSFFSRRFYLLASVYANDDKVLDVLPMQDDRGITPDKWTQSEKGRARVFNEMEQYLKIIKEKSSAIFL